MTRSLTSLLVAMMRSVRRARGFRLSQGAGRSADEAVRRLFSRARRPHIMPLSRE